MKQLKILGIFILDRIKEAKKTQQVLSKYNHLIKARLGFHELHEGSCSRQALLYCIFRETRWSGNCLSRN
jgi:hypothetical protein